MSQQLKVYDYLSLFNEDLPETSDCLLWERVKDYFKNEEFPINPAKVKSIIEEYWIKYTGEELEDYTFSFLTGILTSSKK